MDFKEFVNKLEQDLKEALSDISPGAQVRQTPVEKLQASSYTGISITPADTNIGMNLNGSKNQNVNRNQSKNNSKQVVKGGVRRGSYQS